MEISEQILKKEIFFELKKKQSRRIAHVQFKEFSLTKRKIRSRTIYEWMSELENHF